MTDDEIRKLAEAIGHEVYIAHAQIVKMVLSTTIAVAFVLIVVFAIVDFCSRKK